MRYLGVITGLLEKALRRVEALAEDEQNAIAAQILESLDDEETWARKFREMCSMARISYGSGLGRTPNMTGP